MKDIEKNIDDKVENSVVDELASLKNEITKNTETQEKFSLNSIKDSLNSLKESVLFKINSSEKITDKENENIDIDMTLAKWLEELSDTDEISKVKRSVKKIKKVNFNNVVSKEKEKSFDMVSSSITNWEKEKNPVSRFLLKIADLILKTEK